MLASARVLISRFALRTREFRLVTVRRIRLWLADCTTLRLLHLMVSGYRLPYSHLKILNSQLAYIPAMHEDEM